MHPFPNLQRRFREYEIGNIFVRVMELPNKDTIVNSHAHHFDHVTYCIKGKMSVEREGFPARILEPGNFLLITAGEAHKITALEDDTIGHCIYSHRTPQGEIVEKFTGWPDAYI